MSTDLYTEAIADAKKLREKAKKEAERRLLEVFAPKIDRYLEAALLEAHDASDDDDNILTDLDDADVSKDDEPKSHKRDDGEAGEKVARDAELSLEEPAPDDEAAGISMNPDGSWTLALDDVVVPDDEDAEEPSELNASKKHEVIEKLNALQGLVEAAVGDDKVECMKRLASAYEKVASSLVDGSSSDALDRKAASRMIAVADRISETFRAVSNANDIDAADKNVLGERLEASYAKINDVLAEAVCMRLNRRIDVCEGRVKALTDVADSRIRGRMCRKLMKSVSGLTQLVEAVAGRTEHKKVKALNERVVNLAEELKEMSTDRNDYRRGLNEEEVVLKLDLDDPEAAEEIKADLEGDEPAGDDELDLGDLDLDDEADEDTSMEEADMCPSGESSAEEDVALEGIARLFEDDEVDVNVDVSGDDEADDDGDEGDVEGGDVAAADALERAAEELRAGEATVELVDDEEDVADDDELELDDELDAGPAADDDVVSIDMDELGEALRAMKSSRRKNISEMDTGYYDQEKMGPGARLADFGGASEDREAFVDSDDADVIDEARVRRRRAAAARMRRRRRLNGRDNRVSEGRRSSQPTAREVAKMRRKLSEGKQKLAESNLVAAKLLYVNKLLRRSDISEVHKDRIVDALDEAKSLREAQLLYTNIVRSLKRRGKRLSERRHRPVGAASSVMTSSGDSRRDDNNKAGGTDLLGEAIDLDLWKKHAGLNS